MTEYAGVRLHSIKGALVSGDGQTALIKALDANGEELVVAIPVTQVARLVDVVCGALAAAAKVQERRYGISANASQFAIGKDKAGIDILILTFGSGGKMRFRLTSGMANNMYEVLGVHTGRSIPAPPGTPAN